MEWAPLPNEREEDMADTIRANWAVSKLRETHDKPFFLGVGFYAPHFPNYCPQKYFDLYDSKNIEFPPYKSDDLDDLPEKIRKIKTNRSRIHKRLESIEAIDDAIHGYLACMSYADAMIGRVLDALEGSPYADIKATLKNAAPKTFAKPGTKLNTRRNLVIDGESFYWKE